MKIAKTHRLLAAVIAGFLLSSFASADEPQVVSLSESIGPEIDREERSKFHLFPDIDDFESARILRLSDTRYRLEIAIIGIYDLEHESKNISAEAFELTRFHVRLAEEYIRLSGLEGTEKNREAELIYRLALKYLAQTEYELGLKLFDDLIDNYPESPQAEEAGVFYDTTDQLRKSINALFKKGSLFNQQGRTDIIIFSGYYGLWLGVATPIVLDADSPQSYALGLLLGGPLSVAITYEATRNAEMSKGRATIISLGGHLGTWQGIGWSVVSDAEGRTVVGAGEFGGLGGIILATALTRHVHFSEGHASLTSSGLHWGAWFGLVAAGIADHEDEDLLRDMLIGSDALILTAGIVAKEVRMSKKRVRLINLAGVLGTVAGFGVCLLFETDETEDVFMIAGTGSVIGLGLGAHMTRKHDAGQEHLLGRSDWNSLPYLAVSNRKRSLSISPSVSFRRESRGGSGIVPLFGLSVNF